MVMYGIFTYIDHNNQPNIGKYNMDPVGFNIIVLMFILLVHPM